MFNLFKLNNIIIFLYLLLPLTTAANDNNVFSWITAPLTAMGALFGNCIEVPQFTGIDSKNVNIDLNSLSKWQATSLRVHKEKLIKFNFNYNNVQALPRKYRLLYRIDPRFSKPQIFIKTYDYKSGKFISDFHDFSNGILSSHQTTQTIDNNFRLKIADYVRYFNYRNKIPINQDDVINITLASAGDFFSVVSDHFSDELVSDKLDLITAETKISIGDNTILYSSVQNICSAMRAINLSSNSCKENDSYYQLGNNSYEHLKGSFFDSAFTELVSKLNNCSSSVSFNDRAACLFKGGRGMEIKIGGNIIKKSDSEFIYSAEMQKYFFYYHAKERGYLDFSTNGKISDMFPLIDQDIDNWSSASNLSSLKNDMDDFALNFFHTGRYFMNIEIGSGSYQMTDNDSNNLKIEYLIHDSIENVPSSSISGQIITGNSSVNSDKDGFLWVRVINDSKLLEGNIGIEVQSYSGSNFFSKLIYDEIVTPIQDEFKKLAEKFYLGFISNIFIRFFINTVLLLALVSYFFVFAIGAGRFSMSDAFDKIMRITLLLILLGENSWYFFNTYLFEIFINGSKIIMSSVIGVTSSTDNIFGFIDPIIDKYTTPRIWGLLFIQLLQFMNGLTFFAILTIYSLVLYLRVALEIIVGYLLAFICVYVLISLAPFFLMFFVVKDFFFKTLNLDHITKNWLSMVISFVIKPVILLIFFLLLDQVMGEQILGAITKACWGTLIPIKIKLSLDSLDIPFSLPAVSLPFLSGIPFFIPQLKSLDITNILNIDQIINERGSYMNIIVSSLLCYSYALIARGLLQYVDTIVMSLTGVSAPQPEGASNNASTLTGSVISDLSKAVSPITNTLAGAAATFKDKVIDQNYRSRPSSQLSRNDSNRSSSDSADRGNNIDEDNINRDVINQDAISEEQRSNLEGQEQRSNLEGQEQRSNEDQEQRSNLEGQEQRSNEDQEQQNKDLSDENSNNIEEKNKSIIQENQNEADKNKNLHQGKKDNSYIHNFNLLKKEKERRGIEITNDQKLINKEENNLQDIERAPSTQNQISESENISEKINEEIQQNAVLNDQEAQNKNKSEFSQITNQYLNKFKENNKLDNGINREKQNYKDRGSFSNIENNVMKLRQLETEYKEDNTEKENIEQDSSKDKKD